MALLSMLGTTLVRNADERFINSAKEKMEEALTSSSYLSSDDIFFENQRKLKESFDDFVVKYTS
jgi:hypothetical protein